ncbi:MAG: exodeoxyribonuclease VII large subunit [Clostridia bacterium]|nr:exodeoxyribonuclease VII large subunit [Clostridia bacterium]
MSNIISVSQFNNYVHDILVAEEILFNIEVYGEIFGIKQSGNATYFSIRDADAILSCVMFGNSVYYPKEGDMVLVRGSPNYYVKGGRFSFNVNKIAPYGQGILYQQFLQLKAKLQAMGLFDESIKKPLPEIIKRVGVVTSETGAVIHDIIDVSHRRNPMLDIVLYPAKVQGVGADATIVAGIQALDNTDVDVIIVARGGGSMEDLNCFNSEIVAMAIANAHKPIISAVGHEVDFTIADFVADLRAPTPSAAAELVTSDIIGLRTGLQNNSIRLLNIINRTLSIWTQNILNNMQYIQLNVDKYIEKNTKLLEQSATKLDYAMSTRTTQIFNHMDMIASKLDSLNPMHIMRLGYSLTLDEQGKIVSDIHNITQGQTLGIRLKNGEVTAKVVDKKEIL